MREIRLGDNGGPPLEEEDPGDASWKGWIWRKKHKAVWKTPPREIALRLVARLPYPALGITVKFVDSNDPQNFARAIDGRTRALFCETVSNPALEVTDLDAVQRRFVDCPQVQQCYYVTGEWDFVLVMLVADMDEYRRLTRELFFSTNNVKRFKTLVAMERCKATLDVPIADGR